MNRSSFRTEGIPRCQQRASRTITAPSLVHTRTGGDTRRRAWLMAGGTLPRQRSPRSRSAARVSVSRWVPAQQSPRLSGQVVLGVLGSAVN
eukprot:COSAG04_NODE_388_length_15249_cov_7.616502_2_plen_91_part_00